MSDAESLANAIALVSSQIENISSARKIYIKTLSDKAKSETDTPRDECLE